MTPELWLTLMSIGLVLPVMLVMLFVSLTGRLGRDEDARFLPILGQEHDFWEREEDAGPHDAAHDEGGTP